MSHPAPRHDFWEQALCVTVGLDLFFPGKGGTPKPAKWVCGRCPVTARCLEWALTVPAGEDQHGVYGGTSPRERRKLRQQREAAA